jgi:hypothetical protein
LTVAVARQVTRWRARYVDGTGKEHGRHFVRKINAQEWLDATMNSFLRETTSHQ